METVNTLKNTKKSPNQPRITAIDNKLEPKSRCSKFCIYFLNYYILLYFVKLLIQDENALCSDLFKFFVIQIFNSNDLWAKIKLWN